MIESQTADGQATAEPVVIVGGGQGGVQVAVSLREAGFGGPVSVIDTEACQPYQRPPLSKAYLSGTGDRALIDLRSDSFFTDNTIDLVTGQCVEAIDRRARKIALAGGHHLDYGHLVLATGARPRTLTVPGSNQEGVVYLRTLAEADVLRSWLTQTPQHLVIVGGGFIGLEFATTAAKHGHHVTIVEKNPRVLQRATSHELATCIADEHRAHGTTILYGRHVISLPGDLGRVREVQLDGGDRLPADLVLVGIGAIPNAELAAAAGLAVDNGIVVDPQLKTSDPFISAMGDCAQFPSRYAEASVRIESVQNAVDQARHVTHRILTGATEPYHAVPWFWTHQFDLRVQMVGLPHDDDTCVVSGDPSSKRFSVLRFQGDRLSAVESVNRPQDHVGCRKLFSAGLHPTLTAVRDAGYKLDPRHYDT